MFLNLKTVDILKKIKNIVLNGKIFEIKFF